MDNAAAPVRAKAAPAHVLGVASAVAVFRTVAWQAAAKARRVGAGVHTGLEHVRALREILCVFHRTCGLRHRRRCMGAAWQLERTRATCDHSRRS